MVSSNHSIAGEWAAGCSGAFCLAVGVGGVPVLYCLSRRRLAKAAGLSMRQAVLGIYNPDGAYEAFRRVVAFVETYEPPPPIVPLPPS